MGLLFFTILLYIQQTNKVRKNAFPRWLNVLYIFHRFMKLITRTTVINQRIIALFFPLLTVVPYGKSSLVIIKIPFLSILLLFLIFHLAMYILCNIMQLRIQREPKYRWILLMTTFITKWSNNYNFFFFFVSYPFPTIWSYFNQIISYCLSIILAMIVKLMPKKEHLDQFFFIYHSSNCI